MHNNLIIMNSPKDSQMASGASRDWEGILLTFVQRRCMVLGNYGCWTKARTEVRKAHSRCMHPQAKYGLLASSKNADPRDGFCEKRIMHGLSAWMWPTARASVLESHGRNTHATYIACRAQETDFQHWPSIASIPSMSTELIHLINTVAQGRRINT